MTEFSVGELVCLARKDGWHTVVFRMSDKSLTDLFLDGAFMIVVDNLLMKERNELFVAVNHHIVGIVFVHLTHVSKL
jgi:hypothetical protein